MKKFFKTKTSVVDRGYLIHTNDAPEYATAAVVEDGDGKRTMIEVGHRNWADFDDFISAIIDEYENAPVKLSVATLGDTTDRTCEVCGKNMELAEIDRAEQLAWVSCPEYMAGEDEHDSYSVPLADTGEGTV